MGQNLAVTECANSLEHEPEPILRADQGGSDEASRPQDGQSLSEGHEPARCRASGGRDQGPVAQQLEQIVATGTNAGDPLREELSTHADASLRESLDHLGDRDAASLHRFTDALEHETHSSLLAWEGIVRKDALTRLARLAASQPHAQLPRLREGPEPPRNPATRELQVTTTATGAETTIEDRVGR